MRRAATMATGRAATGMAALRMTTIDQVGRLVLDFYRCAMLPLSPGAPDTGHADDLTGIGADLTEREVGWLMAQEWAVNAEDVLFRRSKLGLRLSAEQRRALDDYMASQRSAAPVLAAQG